MPLCLKCSADGRQPNCRNCASLAPIPAHRKIANAARTLVREFKANDPEIQEARRKAAEFRLKEEMRVARAEERRNQWRRHDRASKNGPCPIVKCPCRTEVK